MGNNKNGILYNNKNFTQLMSPSGIPTLSVKVHNQASIFQHYPVFPWTYNEPRNIMYGISSLTCITQKLNFLCRSANICNNHLFKILIIDCDHFMNYRWKEVVRDFINSKLLAHLNEILSTSFQHVKDMVRSFFIINTSFIHTVVLLQLFHI